MKKVVCDKCGKESTQESTFSSWGVRIGATDVEERYYDLCHSCLRELFNFLNDSRPPT